MYIMFPTKGKLNKTNKNEHKDYFILSSLLYLAKNGVRVTSEVNIAKLQMAAIFFYRFKVWLDELPCLAAYMSMVVVVVSLNLQYL